MSENLYPVTSAPRSLRMRLPLLLIMLANLFSAFLFFLLPLYLEKDLGFDGLRIGLIYGAYNFTAIIGALPFGLGNDRARSAALVTVAVLLVAASALAMSEARAFILFLAAFVLFGLGSNMFRISLDALVYRTNEAGREGWRLALYHSFRMGGFGVGTLLVAWHLDRIGFPSALRMLALASIIMLPLSWLLPPTGTSRHDINTYRSDLRRPEVWIYLAWMFLFSSHWGAEQTSYALFLKHGLGLSTRGVGLYMFGEFVAVVMVLPWLGHRADRGASLDMILIAGLLTSGVGHIGMAWPNVAVSFAFRFLHGFGDAAVFILIALGVSRLFSLERIGGHSGMVMFVTLLGASMGSLIYGPLGEAAGWGAPLVVSGATTLLLIPLYMLVRRKPAHA